MPEFMLLAMCGPARVGKTTAATILGCELGFRLVGFADPIRVTVLDLVPAWSDWNLDEGKDMEDSWLQRSPRDLMRIVGDHARGLQWDVYIRHTERRIAMLRQEGAPGAVLYDLRTELEAEWVRQAGGTLIHLQRSGVGFRADHETEMGIVAKPGDLAIRNPGTVDGLRGELLGTLAAVRSRVAA